MSKLLTAGELFVTIDNIKLSRQDIIKHIEEYVNSHTESLRGENERLRKVLLNILDWQNKGANPKTFKNALIDY